MSALTIVYRPTNSLIPYARNSRTHSEGQIAQLAASIREFGFTNPVLLDGDSGIIAGHGRVLAARLAGHENVPCIELTHLTAAQKRAYVIADNRLALSAGWDAGMLKAEVEDLLAERYDVALTGLDSAEIQALLAPPANDGEGDADDTPELPKHPISVLGDVWILGGHRIVCGDSTDADAVALALDGAKPHLMVTDPPYGVKYAASWRVAAGVNAPSAANGKVLNDDRADWTEAWTLFPGDVAYVWHGALHAAEVAESLEATGFPIRSQIIWAKNSLVIGRGDYHWQHEPCWYAVRKGKAGRWASDRKQTTLWQIDKPHKSETGHSTQKPVECMARPIGNNSKPGDHVYEPFSGSGTTIIACEQTGRLAHAIELNPAYVDVAVLRWQKFTGKQARHADGRLFDEIAGVSADAAE